MSLAEEEKDLALARRLQRKEENENCSFDDSDDEVLYSALDTITDDYMYALQLQEELNKSPDCNIPLKSQTSNLQVSTAKTSIVDESWEYVDPTPDIFSLFKQFNQTYFWGKLDGVEVKWSPKMTLCAGVCSYEGRGGLCSVRLSLPLLKLRPRKDLVQTLLHEMIHAYLFVTQNNKDHNAHGPEFCKHMYRLNKETGAHITIYHTFHDEVELYRQHWWKCNGPCQKRPPYYGILRRATNRAPGPNDPWWNDHQKLCGGTYIKFKEPEGYRDPKKRKSNESESLNSSSPKKPKGLTQQLIIPFSGKGHVLGAATAGKLNATPPWNRDSSSASKASITGKNIVGFPRSGNSVPSIASLPTANKFPKSFCSDNNPNIVSFGSRQSSQNIQGGRLKSNSSSTVTVTQRKPVSTATSPRSRTSVAKDTKTKAKSPVTKKTASPSKLQTLRDMFSKMNPHASPKKWSNGKVRGSTVIRHESSDSVTRTNSNLLKSGERSVHSDSAKTSDTKSDDKMPSSSGVTRNPLYTLNTNMAKLEHYDSHSPFESPESNRRFGASQVMTETKKSSNGSECQEIKTSIVKILDDSLTDTDPIQLLCECPVCNQKIAESEINRHLDLCLGM